MKSLIYTTIEVIVALMVTVYPWSQACTCVHSHPQQSYCNADFVIKGKVKGTRMMYTKYIAVDYNGKNITHRVAYRKEYYIKINKIYKETDKYRNITKTLIYTSPSESSCGLELINNYKYVLTGFVFNGKAYINLCDWVAEWKQILTKQRKGLQYLYAQYCDCQIYRCQHKKCKMPKNTCVWNWRHTSANCYAQNSACVLRNGKCQWSRGKMFKKCIIKSKEKKTDMFP